MDNALFIRRKRSFLFITPRMKGSPFVALSALFGLGLYLSSRWSLLSPVSPASAASSASLPWSSPAAMAGRAFGPMLTHPASGRHTATIIMLHGLGDTGHGWADAGPMFAGSHCRMVFPTAPTRAITVNMGSRMPGWFDIPALDASVFQTTMQGTPMDAAGLEESVAYVNMLVDAEIAAGIPPSRIVLGGFSQGGNVALKVATTRLPPLAGAFGLSTWLEPGARPSPPLDGLAIFLGHGDADSVVPVFAGSATRVALEAAGFKNVSMAVYPGLQHSSCQAEMNDVRAFLQRVLPPTLPSRAELEAFSVKQLKQFLNEHRRSAAGLLEKGDLLREALSVLP